MTQRPSLQASQCWSCTRSGTQAQQQWLNSIPQLLPPTNLLWISCCLKTTLLMNAKALRDNFPLKLHLLSNAMPIFSPPHRSSLGWRTSRNGIWFSLLSLPPLWYISRKHVWVGGKKRPLQVATNGPTSVKFLLAWRKWHSWNFKIFRHYFLLQLTC